MKHYDYILAGGGAAGLSLAYNMIQSPLRHRRILIVDKERKRSNDRTWSFWTTEPTLVDEVVHKRWDRLFFSGMGWDAHIDMAPYHYQTVRGIDFYNMVYAALDRVETVDFLYGMVDEVRDGDEAAVVLVDGEPYSAGYVFDSLFFARDFRVDESRYHFIKQHFVGWEIETETDAFDPNEFTMFDFRTPQHGSMRFMYVLPTRPNYALVEYTLFSYDLLAREEYERALREYISDVLGISSYRVAETEDGIIPMTDMPFPRRGGERILYTGTKGGRVKASTGYAFHRTLMDAHNIVQSLIRNEHPFELPETPKRFRTMDTVLLQVLYRHGERAEEAFTSMFRYNPIERLLGLLDEDLSLKETVKLMTTVPIGLFMRAWARSKLLGKI
jgi:lycopene beta-cyclase